VGEAFSIADIALFAYTHTAPEGGIELDRYPGIGAWLERVRAVPGFVPLLGPWPASDRMSALPNPIPARMRQVNRAEVVDGNFTEFVQAHAGARWAKPGSVDRWRRAPPWTRAASSSCSSRS
jgi:hypothetical protein